MKNFKKVLVFSSVFVLIFGSSMIFAGCKDKKKDDLTEISAEFSNYYIDLEYDNQTKSAVVDCEIDYCNNTDAMLKNIKLHLYISAFCKTATKPLVSDTSFDDCFYNGESFAGLNISRVQYNSVDIMPNYEGDDNDIMEIVSEKENT